ncbi:MAG: S9 family peptidase, partial [Halioglobus sp.]|nr:S9 family peptidase [Halioglobus sp.]
MTIRLLGFLAAFSLGSPALAGEQETANNGKLVMQGIPGIPAAVVDDLNRFQNVRAASFLDWSADGNGIYVSTRFADVNQVHRVDRPGGARQQLTFFSEPVSEVQRRPGSNTLSFRRDAGGSEFAQIFLLDPKDGTAAMLTDGESRNGSTVWNRQGTQLSYQSTRRNGASNDVWLMDPADADSSRVVLESPDGSSWTPTEFSASGSKLLISNYVSVADSRIHLLDLDSGKNITVSGGGEQSTSNYPLAFSEHDEGMWFITNRDGEFDQLAWQSFEAGSKPEIVTADIPWDVNAGAISNDRRRIAFLVNDDGRSMLYLLDARTRQY